MDKGELIKDIARSAGEILRDGYKKTKTWRIKSGPGDVVTEIDERSEEYIIDRIKRVFPEDSILSEECGAIGEWEDNDVWVIDPLDGTRNYTMNIPFFCTSIAVARHGVPYIGVIYDPIHDEMFFAERGKGAYLNGERISVSAEQTIEDSIISVSWVKSKADRKKFVEYIEKLSKDTSYFRRFGSAALVLAYVACARIHGYLQAGLNPWDVAAGIVILEEAGGVITDFAGKSIDLRDKNIEVVTGNQALHATLLDIIAKVGSHN